MVSYSVAQRTREFGIRVTLGSSRWRLFGLVLGQATILSVCGIAIGVAAAAPLLHFLARTIKTSMFIDLVTGPLLFVAVGGAIIAVSLMATYIPASRATRVDPIIALRCE